MSESAEWILCLIWGSGSFAVLHTYMEVRAGDSLSTIKQIHAEMACCAHVVVCIHENEGAKSVGQLCGEVVMRFTIHQRSNKTTL